MSMYSKHEMFCTICGQKYLWNANFPFSNSRTCSWDCHREWAWRDVLSIMGKPYEPRKKIGFDFGNTIKKSGGELMEGFMDAFRQLQKIFHEDVYIISRVDDEEGSKKALKFLKENRLLDCENSFENGHVRFCLKREEKGPIAEKLGLTHFVDDRTECLHHMKTVKHRFAINPTSKQIEEFPPDGMHVASNWEELTPMIIATTKKIACQPLPT